MGNRARGAAWAPGEAKGLSFRASLTRAVVATESGVAGRRGSRARPQPATWALARRGGLLEGALLSERAGLPQALGVALSRDQPAGGTGPLVRSEGTGGLWGAAIYGSIRRLPRNLPAALDGDAESRLGERREALASSGKGSE